MADLGIAFGIFVLLAGVVLLTLWGQLRLPARLRNKETHDVIKLGVGMVSVMASLVLGLFVTSVKGSFDAVDRDVHQFATRLILLDTTLRAYGPDAEGQRQQLIGYTEMVLTRTWSRAGDLWLVKDDRAWGMLTDLELHIDDLATGTPRQASLAAQARSDVQRVIEQRWTLIADAQATFSSSLLIVLILWFVVIFASFGYNAPPNVLVLVSLMICAAAISSSIFMVLEIDGPFSGLIQVSPQPVEDVLASMKA
ncbi:Protein of unknown function [Faunimonas pinastri]|uniref:DUF4239 domain-containing protein n=1 Tax=Faunimonas pinastri TaxID=1855383 RepID=A0A1H9PXA7_9HYPH|nr:DUF4239 domain-containing protein [Faunimonas pinastri]SER52243.1 Protein of unknown function [Faunimonas pinastri]